MNVPLQNGSLLLVRNKYSTGLLTIRTNDIVGVDNFFFFCTSSRVHTIESNLPCFSECDSGPPGKNDLNGIRCPTMKLCRVICKFNGGWLHRPVHSLLVQVHRIQEYAFNGSLMQSNLVLCVIKKLEVCTS